MFEESGGEEVLGVEFLERGAVELLARFGVPDQVPSLTVIVLNFCQRLDGPVFVFSVTRP